MKVRAKHQVETEYKELCRTMLLNHAYAPRAVQIRLSRLCNTTQWNKAVVVAVNAVSGYEAALDTIRRLFPERQQEPAPGVQA